MLKTPIRICHDVVGVEDDGKEMTPHYIKKGEYMQCLWLKPDNETCGLIEDVCREGPPNRDNRFIGVPKSGYKTNKYKEKERINDSVKDTRCRIRQTCHLDINTEDGITSNMVSLTFFTDKNKEILPVTVSRRGLSRQNDKEALSGSSL